MPTDRDGYVERDGIKIFYEVFGAGEPTILLLPTWSLMHSRHWKMQVPYLARHCRVLTFDGRGNGRSDRPTQAEAYAESEFAADAIAVMDATQTDRAIIVSFSLGAQRGAAARRKPSAAGRGGRLHRPDISRRRGATARTNGVLLGGRARHRRRLGEVQQALLAARLPGLSRLLPVDNVPRAALDQANRGWRWLGPGDHRRNARPHATRAWRPTRRVSSRDASAARSWSYTATATGCPTCPAGSRSPSTRAVGWLCSKAPAMHRTYAIRSRSTSFSGTSPSRRPHRIAGCVGSPVASARSTSPRRSGSATRSAMSRSPTSCARCIPTSRSTGLRSTR